ncbi:hypothetical protein BGX31_007640 [Mortierella sp. GBA43]|nr:hypothetical protein BGX31_007640 [Mortierella sp. GBA43]
MACKNPLYLPEILTLVGKNITLWRPSGGAYDFYPKDMLSCTQVSHYFRNTLLPILWCTFDEREFYTVPIEVIQKYTPYFRFHFNYGLMENYPNIDRPLSTDLIQLSVTKGHIQEHDIEYIKSNRHLKSLEGLGGTDNINTLYGDMFNNFDQLEHFHYDLIANHGSSHQQLFRPISGTLKSLRLFLEDGTLGLGGLVFPQMKELAIELSSLQDTIDILRGCPNLKSLRTTTFARHSSVGHILAALEPGVCPQLKTLNLPALSNLEAQFVAMLEGRTGLQNFQLRLGFVSKRLFQAIAHHGSTLTHLSIHKIRWSFSTMPFVLQLLGSCGQLKSVNVGGLEHEPIDPLMTHYHWKNPGVLESLTLEGASMSLRSALLESNRKTFLAYKFMASLLSSTATNVDDTAPPPANPSSVQPLVESTSATTIPDNAEDFAKVMPPPVTTPASQSSMEYLDRWKPVQEAEIEPQNKAFMSALFESAEEYSRLRTITVNNVVYEKIVSQ